MSKNKFPAKKGQEEGCFDLDVEAVRERARERYEDLLLHAEIERKEW